MAGRGDKPSVDDYNDALTTLDMIFKTWASNHGVAFWDIVCNSQTLTAGSKVSHNSKVYQCILNHTADSTNEPGVGADWADYWEENSDISTTDLWVSGLTYTVVRSLTPTSTNCVDISNLHINYNGSFWQVELVSKDELFNHDTLTTGMPTKAYLSHSQIGGVVAIFNRIPNRDYEFKYYAMCRPETITAENLGVSTPIPDNWLKAAVYALAVELSYLYSIDLETIQLLTVKARAEFKKCLGTDRGGNDLCFVKSTF